MTDDYEMEYPLICHKCGINPDVNVLFIQNKVKTINYIPYKA